MTKILKMNMASAIYIAVSFAIVVLGLLSGTLTLAATAGYFIISGIAFMFITKKFQILIPIASIYLLLNSIVTLPSMVYSYTGQDPSFVIAAPIIGFLITLLVSNLTYHAEYSIRSPWVANIFGVISMSIIEFILLEFTSINSQLIIGFIGLLFFLIASFSWVSLGKKVKINKPNSKVTEEIRNQLIRDIQAKYLTKTSFIKKTETTYIIDKDSKYPYSYKLIFINEDLSKKEVIKGKKTKTKFFTYSNGVEKDIYAWLYREAVKTIEIKADLGAQKTIPLIVNMNEDNEKTEPIIDTFLVKIPRSRNSIAVGYISISKNKKMNMKALTDEIVNLTLASQ